MECNKITPKLIYQQKKIDVNVNCMFSTYNVHTPYKAVVKSIFGALGNMRISVDLSLEKVGEKGNTAFPLSCRHGLYQVVVTGALPPLVLLNSLSEYDG